MANPSHDLLPCPFCGGTARYDDEYDDRGNAVIACNECGANVGANELTPGIERWNRRATPPSPSTAPEVDERAAFEAWLAAPKDEEWSTFNIWRAGRRSALASRPAEVDDEGLPPLPDQYVELSPFPGRKYFTADQYRQGQRDAVAADRAKVSRAIDLLREARAALETWKDVAPAVSLCADIDKVLAGGGQ